MSAFRHVPPAPGGPRRALGRSSYWVLAIVAVAAIEFLGSVAVTPHGSLGAGPTPGSAAPPVLTPAVANTHGDLVVASGQKVYIPQPNAPPTPTTYFQGGNITVESGGTLIVENTTLSFVQYVAGSGIPAARLHVYRFLINAGGTALFFNSTITTDTFVLNPYAKLQIEDNGVLTLWHSSIRTGGEIAVGAGGDLTLNATSTLAPNAAVTNLTGPKTVLADSEFAPTLSVAAGGQANLFGSQYVGLYGDNLAANGAPNPRPLTSTGVVNVTTGENWSRFSTPTDPLNVTQDYLYPSGIASGNLTINYTDSSGSSTVASVTVWYGGSSFLLGSATFVADSSGSIVLPFAAGSGLANAINTGGLMAWLNRTGDFGLPSGISVAFQVTNGGPNVDGVNLAFQLSAPVEFGPTVNGAGSTLSTVDSFIGLNFTSLSAHPWQSHQLVLTNGATAFLGNLSTQGNIQNGTSQFAHGAVVANGTSNATLFRWADLAITGKVPELLVVNASVAAPYGYGVSQLDNATAQWANAFRTSDPAIWAYLQSWDAHHVVASYGDSSANGIAALLLASSWINASTSPDGNFVGDYHVVVTPPAGSGAPQSFNASVAPYPLGVANGSAGYQLPTSWGQMSFSGYYANVAISAHNGVVVTADSTVTSSIPVGQLLGVAVNITDIGTAPITLLNGSLYYNAASPVLVASVSKPVDLKVPGQNSTVKVTWLVNDSVVGVLGPSYLDTLLVKIVWNDNETSKGGGTLSTTPTVQFVPGMFLAARNGLVVTADGAVATKARVGQLLSVDVNLTDNSTVPITALQATVTYPGTPAVTVASLIKSVDLTAPGQNLTLRLTWRVNDTVTGINLPAVNVSLLVAIIWNSDSVLQDGGFLTADQKVTFEPSEVALTGETALPTSLATSAKYLTTGAVIYNGSHEAEIELIATPTGGGLPITLATSYVGPAAPSQEGSPVAYGLNWDTSELQAGTSYFIKVVATYPPGGSSPVTATYTYPGTYEVPSPGPSSIFTEKFLGLELWLWMVIAAAIVAGAIAFLLFSRRQAAGKLVECGECGNLVPEDAKVCPKCGAEFESDVVRCSRCSSTIPGSSKFCPECAAQLLGRPGEAGLDPERQAYADFTERFRAEAKKDLGDNYSESSFWDWWKRQPSYTPFSQWKIQQGQGTPRVGMTAPPPGGPPPGGPTAPAPAPRRPQAAPRPPPPPAAQPAPAPAPAAAPGPAAGALKPCPNCKKEIPAEYLVCPFCAAVTQ